MNNITVRTQDWIAGRGLIHRQRGRWVMVKASLTLFGGDTVVVRCSERCHIHLMSTQKNTGRYNTDILSVQNEEKAYLTVPYSGTWNVLIDSHSQSLEHSISYVAA